MARRIFVGDIQGCLGPFDRLLEATGFDPRHGDRLFAVGDLVAKGPDSVGVLRRMIDVGGSAVLGNHDLLWLKTGRIADPVLDAWLRGQPIVRLFDDVVMVHAALHPHWNDARLEELASAPHALDGVDVDFAVSVRYCTADGVRPDSDWPPPPPPFRPWDEFYRGRRRVVFGHWARRGLDVTPRVIALDSGCVYGRSLSAWIAEEDRIVQVPGL